MSKSAKQPLSNHPLWLAIENGDVAAARTLLEDDPALVSRDFRLESEQDPHTFGFPLVRAVDTGNVEMIALLLDHGAEVDKQDG